METALKYLRMTYPHLGFRVGQAFFWSPDKQEVVYDPTKNGPKSVWSLLHETGHALLDHRSYQADFELVSLEVAAWDKAKQLATNLALTIDEDHIQNCLDTYRNWLFRRSICPECSTRSLQQGDFVHYRCHNCHAIWRVTPSRFCRAYRTTKNVNQVSSVFQLTDNL